jgi:SAM-dependent methyltransferase
MRPPSGAARGGSHSPGTAVTAASASSTPSTPPDRDLVSIDSTVAHTSRIYDYLLGGDNHFAIDREVAEDAFATYPGGLDGARADARANRAFLGRVVGLLVREVGIRQFLDIGPGIPDSANTHQLAQAVAPESRVVYVDNDAIVLAHAHELLAGDPGGATAYLHGDLRRPDNILTHAAKTLDLGRPIGLLMTGILHVVPDADDPQRSVARLVEALAPDSHVAISHMTNHSVEGADLDAVGRRLDERMHTSNPPALRDRDGVAAFLDGLELLEPGLVPVPEWRPDGDVAADARPTPLLGAVARKP